MSSADGAAPGAGTPAGPPLIAPSRILDLVRPLVIVVDGLGQVLAVHGGYGGFLGYDTRDLVGVSVFDFVAPDEVDEVATYFAESAGESLRTISLPLPFRVTLIGADGREHPVDVIPTGQEHAPDLWGWVVVLVPVALNASVSRSLDAEMSGAPRERVKELLTEELAVDNEHYCTRWFLVDLDDPSRPAVITSRADDLEIAAAIRSELTDHRWQPWAGVAPGDTRPLDAAALPPPIDALAAARNWRRVSVTPVHLDGALVAAYLLMGRVDDQYPVDEVKTNVRERIRKLVDVTALLVARWRERDRLVSAATRDSLTGLANRDAFFDALAAAGDSAVVFYVDVDFFKEVNDRFGHDVGDRVLVTVAERIVAACRPGDVVARLGGDEFAVLLDGVGPDEARAIGRRVVDTVALPLAVPDGPDRVTVSVGMATRVESLDLVNTADRAMLLAKRSGRARLVWS